MFQRYRDEYTKDLDKLLHIAYVVALLLIKIKAYSFI